MHELRKLFIIYSLWLFSSIQIVVDYSDSDCDDDNSDSDDDNGDDNYNDDKLLHKYLGIHIF